MGKAFKKQRSKLIQQKVKESQIYERYMARPWDSHGIAPDDVLTSEKMRLQNELSDMEFGEMYKQALL